MSGSVRLIRSPISVARALRAKCVVDGVTPEQFAKGECRRMGCMDCQSPEPVREGGAKARCDSPSCPCHVRFRQSGEVSGTRIAETDCR